VKTVEVNKAVGDAAGLMADLRARGFAVLNVGSRRDATIVWLDDSEAKNPTAAVEAWMGRPGRPVPERVPSVPEPVEEASVENSWPPRDAEPKRKGFFARLFGRANKVIDGVAWWKKDA